MVEGDHPVDFFLGEVLAVELQLQGLDVVHRQGVVDDLCRSEQVGVEHLLLFRIGPAALQRLLHAGFHGPLNLRLDAIQYFFGLDQVQQQRNRLGCWRSRMGHPRTDRQQKGHKYTFHDVLPEKWNASGKVQQHKPCAGQLRSRLG